MDYTRPLRLEERSVRSRRLLGRKSGDNANSDVDREKERANYLLVAEEAWHRFFRPDAAANDADGDNASDNDSDNSDGNGNSPKKEEYLQMAMEAWDNAGTLNAYYNSDYGRWFVGNSRY